MKPTLRLILLAIIIFILGAVPVVHAVVPTDSDLTNATPVTCADPPTSWNGEITSADQVDYYSIGLVAGQVLTIDVDAEDLSSLDSLLEVFDVAGNPIGASDDDRAPWEKSVVDPYLEITVDGDDTYYLAISASSKTQVDDGGNTGTQVDDGGNTGSYMLFLQCSDPSNPPGPITEVKTGDLLVTTGSASGSLIRINPDNWESSLRLPLQIGPIADIDFDPISKVLFAAMDTGYPGSIVTINPNDGTKVAEFNYAEGGFVALESAGDILYGVHLTNNDIDAVQAVDRYSLVTISQTPDGLTLTTVASLTGHVSSLAYHSSENALYGVMGNELVKFDPALGENVRLGELDVGTIVALDFDPDNFLYVATAPDSQGNPGKLFQINHTDLTIMREAGSFDVSTGSVNGLSFVVEKAPPDVEPIKTLCSSTLTSPMTASSETDVSKLSRLNHRLKRKHNPLHRAIGLFKFKGRAGEKVTLRLAPEVEESVESGEEYAVSALLKPWLKCRGKGRVFLGIRDAIPNIDFRARKKDQMPFDMSADLPEDGDYYVMVIRPLLRFYKTDYCLTLESDHPDSEAWRTLDVVWPGDDSEEDTATTSTEAKTAEVQSDEVLDEGSSGSEDTTPGETTGVVPTLTASEPVGVAPASSAPEPDDEDSGQEVQAVEETAVDETGEVAPAEQPTAEATDEPIVKGAPSIPEETTVDENGEIAPEESADEISGDDESTDGSGSAEVADDDSDGAESAEGDTSNVVEEEPTEASTS